MANSSLTFTVFKSAIALSVGFCFGARTLTAAEGKASSADFTLTSPAFTDGGALPAGFTCDGERASPPLEWSNPPAGTQSFAITMHHIPGPGDKHVYMVIYNIPADVRSLAKNSRNVGKFGTNTVNGKQEYTPPCSKGPGAKKYTMTVYALSAEPKFDQPAGSVTMDILLSAIKNTTLGTARLNVTYTRPEQAIAAADQGAGPAAPGAAGAPDAAGGPDQAGRPPRGGPEQRALDQLQLTPDEKSKVDPIIRDFREKQKKLRDELLANLKAVLDDKQYQQFQAAFPHPPGPPPAGQGGDNNGPPPDQGGNTPPEPNRN